MLTHSAARCMAEAKWGRGGTKSHKTNRNGVFYFSCSGHGGFIIDARALTENELKAISGHIEPDTAVEYCEAASGKVRRTINPYLTRSRSYRTYMSWTREEFSVFAAEEDCDWCIPFIFAGIHVKAAMDDDFPQSALASFERWKNPSAHQMLEARALVKKHLKS